MPQVRLTEQQKKDIVANYFLVGISQRALAKQFGVSQPAIRYVIKRAKQLMAEKDLPKRPEFCKKGLHCLDEPGARNSQGGCRVCLNQRVRNQRRDRPEKYSGYSTKYNRIANGVLGDTSIRNVGNCELCDKFCDPLHLDHNHVTGEQRGWLCVGCNMRVGVLERHTWLSDAHQYLNKYGTILPGKWVFVEDPGPTK